MAKYKPYTYAQDMLIPVSLNEQIMPGSLEYAIHMLVKIGVRDHFIDLIRDCHTGFNIKGYMGGMDCFFS